MTETQHPTALLLDYLSTRTPFDHYDALPAEIRHSLGNRQQRTAALDMLQAMENGPIDDRWLTLIEQRASAEHITPSNALGLMMHDLEKIARFNLVPEIINAGQARIAPLLSDAQQVNFGPYHGTLTHYTDAEFKEPVYQLRLQLDAGYAAWIETQPHARQQEHHSMLATGLDRIGAQWQRITRYSTESFATGETTPTATFTTGIEREPVGTAQAAALSKLAKDMELGMKQRFHSNIVAHGLDAREQLQHYKSAAAAFRGIAPITGLGRFFG